MKEKFGFGFYHFDPRWTSFETFDEYLSRGYINSTIVVMDSYGTALYAAKKMKEIGGEVWLCATPFYSAKETIQEYMEKIDKFVQRLKDDDVFDVIAGFHWDEPLLHRPHTNQDFLTMTKALTEAYGKRIYPVFSVQEVAGVRGNIDDPEGDVVLEKFATEYITDTGFDSYGFDFREPSTEAMQRKLMQVHEKYPNVNNTTDYYKNYIDALKRRCINPNVKIWVYPCAYNCNTWAQIPADEDYCIAHLNGLKDILLEQEHIGGIHSYTFKSWGTKSRAMDYFLSKDCPVRWNKYEEACKEVYKELQESIKGE